MRLYQQQRSALERGALTEDVVMPKVLGDIVKTIAQSGYDVIQT